MNFIEEFKKFENWLLVHPNVSPSARLVWHSLLHYNNLCGWKEEFDLSMSALQLSTGLSAPTIRKAREQLRLMGRIEYRKGSMDHSAVYRLNPLPALALRRRRRNGRLTRPQGRPVLKELPKGRMKDPIQEPMKVPMKVLLKEPIQEPIKKTIQEPMKELTKEPTKA